MKQKSTILIIDDNPEDRYTYRRFLEREEQISYEILEAETVEEGLAIYNKTNVDLIIIDYFLTDLDGIEMVKELRKKNQLIPIIMVTGSKNPKVAVNSIKGGANEYLIKEEIKQDFLNQTVKNVIEKAKLQQRLQQQEKNQKLMAEIALRIHNAFELQDILKVSVTEVRQLLQADRVLVYQFEPDFSGIIVAEAVLPQWKSALNINIKDTCFQENSGGEYLQGKTKVMDDIETANLTECHLNLLTDFQIKSNLIVPILTQQRNKLWGLLVAHQCGFTRYWLESEVNLLEKLAIQISIAIQQAELYHKLENLNLELEKKVEQRTAKLKESEQRFRLMADSAPVLIWMGENEDNFTYFNKTWLDFTGDSLKGAISKSFYENLHPEERKSFRDSYSTVLKARKEFTTEFRLKRRDGIYRWMLNTATPRFSDNGNFKGYISSCVDISDRKIAEQELKASNKFIEKITQALPSVLYIYDLEKQNTIYINKEATNVLGYNLEQIQTMGANFIQQMMHPEDFPRFIEHIKNIEQMQDKELVTFEYRMLNKQRKWRWFLSTDTIFERTAEGKVKQIIGTGQDITDRKQSEKLIKNSLTEKELLLREIHHRVKNNLNIIHSILAMQGRQIKDNKLSELLTDSQRRVRTMALIHEMLYRSKNLAQIDFEQYLKHLFNNINSAFSSQENQIRAYFEAEAIKLNINLAIPCGLILNELITNAFKHAFTPDKQGEIRLKLKQQKEGYLLLAVKDNGVGFASEQSNKISLGMKLVNILVEQIDGELEISSNNGAEFTIIFPVNITMNNDQR